MLVSCFLVISSILLFSCGQLEVARKPPAKDNSAANLLSEYFISGKIKGDRKSDSLATVFHLTLPDPQSAMVYAMERRLFLLRKFETLIEPYFGTIHAKDCQNNIRSTLLKRSEETFSAVLQVPSYGPSRTIHDCLLQNNTDWAHIEFLTCGKDFYDIRFYTSIDAPPPYQQVFSCGPNP